MLNDKYLSFSEQNKDDDIEMRPDSSQREVATQTFEAEHRRISRIGKKDRFPVWNIGGFRHVSVNEYRDRFYIDIREYYLERHSRKMEPSRKGICLTLNEFGNLLRQAEEVKQYLYSINPLIQL